MTKAWRVFEEPKGKVFLVLVQSPTLKTYPYAILVSSYSLSFIFNHLFFFDFFFCSRHIFFKDACLSSFHRTGQMGSLDGSVSAKGELVMQVPQQT